MTKTQEFAQLLAPLINDFEIVSVHGKTIKLKYVGDEYDFDSLKGVEITMLSPGRCGIFMNKRLAFFVKGNTLQSQATTIAQYLAKYCADKTEQHIRRTTNQELCDYLISRLTKFEIINKSSTTDRASFTIEGPSGTRFVIKARYTDTVVSLYRINQGMSLICQYDLSNPEIEQIIARDLAKRDALIMRAKNEEKDENSPSTHHTQHQSA